MQHNLVRRPSAGRPALRHAVARYLSWARHHALASGFAVGTGGRSQLACSLFAACHFALPQKRYQIVVARLDRRRTLGIACQADCPGTIDCIGHRTVGQHSHNTGTLGTRTVEGLRDNQRPCPGEIGDSAVGRPHSWASSHQGCLGHFDDRCSHRYWLFVRLECLEGGRLFY